MRYAIVESGGKQYRAFEGRAIEVDRLPVDVGKKFDFERILLMADGDEVMVGTPTVNDILVKVTVVEHIKGPKIDRFKYRPKKRIRVRGGHRQQYTRLMVDFIGRQGEERTLAPGAHLPRVQVPGSAGEVEEPEVTQEAETEVVVEAKPKTEKAPKAEKQAKAKKASAKSATTQKPTTSKSSSKKTDSKKK
ncbi:MAG: 50S ribosomal protein L21 [Anaerolineales bacterium]